MQQTQPKFKVGQTVQDTVDGKTWKITALKYQCVDEVPQWYYSFDSLGWYFYPEEDLVAV